MKTFDELLRAAFDAGYERALDDQASSALIEQPPAFEQWRASIGDPE